MNIWTWVRELRKDLAESGQPDLSRKIGQVSNLAVRGDADQVDAMFQEVLAAASVLEMPWLEVYARHWSLQSRLISRGQGLPCLNDTIDAFERANRDATRDCPQSICTTQDLGLCFGNVDAVGYASDILQATEETLGRIDPTWGCFECLTEVRVDALIDLDLGEKAVEIYTAAREGQRELGVKSGDSFRLKEASMYAELERYESALELLDSPGLAGFGDLATPAGRTRRGTRPWVLAHLGRLDEATDTLLPFAEIRERVVLHRYWSETVEILAQAGVLPNDAELGEQLQSLLATSVAAGRPRPSARLALIAGRLAVQRGAVSSARHALSTAVRQADGLRSRPQLAPEIDALSDQVAAMLPVVLPVAASDLIAYLEANRHSAEQTLDWLLAAAIEQPDDVDLVGWQAHLLSASSRLEDARALLVEATERLGYPTVLTTMLGSVLIRMNRDDDLLALARSLEDRDPVMTHYLRARLSEARSRWKECAQECAAAVAIDGTLINTRRLWITAAEKQGDWPTAQRVLRDLIGQDGTTPADRWELLVAATARQDWPTVRETAAALEMQLPDGSDRPEAPMGTCWVAPSGSRVGEHFAWRIGPALARIVSVAQRDRPQRAGDVIVIRPAPLEPVPTDPDERRTFVPTFAEVTVLEPCNATAYVVAGPVPSLATWFAACNEIRAQGWYLWTYSGPDYTLRVDGSVVPAVWALVAVPADVPCSDADVRLEELVASWDPRPSWPDLVAAAGRDPASHKQLRAQCGLLEPKDDTD